MKSINRVKQVVIFTSIFVGILLLVYILVGRPVLKYFDGLKAEFGQKQAKLQESQELVRSLPNPQKAIDEIKVKLQEFQDLAVSKKQVPRLMQLLGQTASERNITVVSLRPREDIKNENGELPAGINKIYLEIVVICSYQTLAEYIKSVSELPPAFNVESLTMEKESETLALLETKSSPKNPGAASGLLKAVLVLSSVSG
jgi:Tfp pilus assembly protein PilO